MKANCSVAISLVFVVLITHSNYAAIEGFVETFSGTETSEVQPLTGFDNDGWLSAGDSVIQDGKLIIINEPFVVEEHGDVFRRDGTGFGSFRETIRFSYLDLGNYNSNTRPSIASVNFVRLTQSFDDEHGETIAYFRLAIFEFADLPSKGR